MHSRIFAILLTFAALAQPAYARAVELVFTAEDMPTFNGGALQEFLIWTSQHIAYTERVAAVADSIRERAIVRFVVEVFKLR